MALITLLNAHLAFGHVALLDHADFSLETGERVGLIGRNGAGKSSLLRILGGMEKPDDGTLQYQQNLRLAFVAQEPILNPTDTVFTAVSTGLAPVIALINQYCDGIGDLDSLQSEIESATAGTGEQRVDETLHRLHLDPRSSLATCPEGTRSESRWLRLWLLNPTCCYWTSPPTIWIWIRSSGSKTC
jgi:ATP-binding cassette subfamily F protein uup